MNLNSKLEIKGSFAVDGDGGEAANQQNERSVNEIESSDGHLGTALRWVYEGADAEKFLECLETRIVHHDKTIELMCNHHYQGFIESVHSLLQVRTDVDKLKHEIHSVDGELQASGSRLLLKWKEQVTLRKQQENIETTIQLMTACLPVLEMFNKLNKQMQQKRFYPALKTLEMLEHTYLPQVSKYTFTEKMGESVAVVRLQIKEASLQQLRDFLESLRRHSGRIGEVTMRQTARENGIEVDSVSEEMSSESPRRHSTFSIINLTDHSEDGLSAQELIDFSPVHRCLHIYSVLGDKESFEKYYRIQRKKQCDLAIQASKPLLKEVLEARSEDHKMSSSLKFYSSYFHEIVGFFVVEEHILHTTQHLLCPPDVTEAWEVAQAKIIAVLRTHIGQCTDTEILLKVKKLLMMFSLSMRNHGFSCTPLFDLLLEVRDQYSDILRHRWVGVFERIFDEDNYTPILITNQQHYLQVTNIYPYKNNTLEAMPFPKNLPFSQFVPAIYAEVKRYIMACLHFTQDLQISCSDVDDTMRRLANSLLTKALGLSLASLIKKPSLSLPQLIQISINMEHLDHSCVYLEHFITQLSGLQGDNNRVSKLHGHSMFKTAKSEAESEMYRQINLKIDEFFDLADYDWTAMEEVVVASSYTIDMTAFLSGIFHSFTNLHEKVAQTACMSACKHMAELMMALLKSDEVKCLSDCVLKQVSLDLEKCEDFALQAPVVGIDRVVFKMAFEDLRQLLDLFTTDDWTNYLSDYQKEAPSRYQRVQPAMCIVLLEKLKEWEKRRSNLLSSFKRNERKKLIEACLKQLKMLM